MAEVELYAVAAAHYERARAIAEQFGIPRAYAPAEALLADPEVDVVVIATPPSTHSALARAAVEAGKHFICEKPLALSPEEANVLCELVRKAGIRATVNYVMRYMPVYERLRELLRNGAIGNVQAFIFLNAAPRPQQAWFFQPEQSGGILVEHGVHFYGLATWLLQDDFLPTVTLGDALLEAWSWGTFRESGCTGLFWHSFRKQPGTGEVQQLVLVGEAATVLVEGWIPTVLKLVTEHGTETLLQTPERQQLYQRALQQILRELLHWIEHPERPPRVSLEDACRSLAVAVEARRRTKLDSPWSSSAATSVTPS
jgi:predicted dehydrogenase